MGSLRLQVPPESINAGIPPIIKYAPPKSDAAMAFQEAGGEVLEGGWIFG